MKPVLFIDFDGTLCHDRFWRSLESEDRTRVQEFLFTSRKELVGQWMTGEHTSEDINLLISKELGIPYERLWKVFVLDCKNMKVDANALGLISRLRDRFRTILTTDNMDCFKRFTIESLQLDKYFDEIMDSYTLKQLKSEKLFSDAAVKSGSSLSECILIDNSKNTCTLFENLGGKSLFVTKEQPLTYWLKTLAD